MPYTLSLNDQDLLYTTAAAIRPTLAKLMEIGCSAAGSHTLTRAQLAAARLSERDLHAVLRTGTWRVVDESTGATVRPELVIMSHLVVDRGDITFVLAVTLVA